MVDEPMSGTPGDRCHIMAFGGPAEVLKLVQAERPLLAIDEDEIEVELPQNVDDPRRWEGKVVAVRLAAGAHGGFDAVGLLHPMSSCVGDCDLIVPPCRCLARR